MLSPPIVARYRTGRNQAKCGRCRRSIDHQGKGLRRGQTAAVGGGGGDAVAPCRETIVGKRNHTVGVSTLCRKLTIQARHPRQGKRSRQLIIVLQCSLKEKDSPPPQSQLLAAAL